MQQIRRAVLLFFLTVLLSCSLGASAQGPKPRLTGPVSTAARTVLAGSRSPAGEHAQDRGAVSPEMTIPGMTLVFKRTAEQENALQELLQAQQNTASPLYHRWLTPDSFAAQFGVADEDIAATEGWLRSRGFRIEATTGNRDRITFSGNAAQVQAAFGTELHSYQTDGELHFAPASDLSLPAELASMTGAVLHLSNFRPKPNVKTHAGPRPDYTALSTQAHYLDPNDILMMYDLGASFQSQALGAGQALAVVGQSYVATTFGPVAEFNSALAPAGVITTVLVPGSGVQAISPGDQGESEIDLEYASGIAANASIFLVYVGANQNYDVFDALAFAITRDIAPVVSISYSVCESSLSATEMDQGNALFEQAAAQGQTLVAASGDAGSTGCAFSRSSDFVTLAQQQALWVGYPADSPYVTAVGGTQMAPGTFAAGPSTYWAAASNFDAARSLLSYVPEVVWNEGSASRGIAASGGGASAHFARPTWQSGAPGIAAGSYRLLPDIAFQASIESPGFLICTDDPALLSSNGQTSSCGGSLMGSNGKYTTAGGTSFAAPIFAGMVSVLNESEQATGLGNINPVLYSLASTPATYASVFHDIESGSNACVPGIANCGAPGESAYAAGPGYDQATGLGSVDFAHLAAAWPASRAANLTPTSMLIVSSQYTAAPGDNVPVQIVVNSLYSSHAPPVPGGAVSVSVDGIVVQPSLALTSTSVSDSSATVEFSFVAASTPGSHLLTVTYPGDATHSPSAATYSVLVGDVTASGSFKLSVPNMTIANGSTGSAQVTVTPGGGYSGRVVWSISSSGSAGTTSLNACYVIGSPAVSGTVTENLTIGVGSACSSSFPADRSNLRRIVPHAVAKSEGPAPPWRGAPKMVAWAGVLLCGLLGCRRRTRLPKLLAVAMLAFAGLGLNGCGGGGSGGAGSGGGSGNGGSTTANVETYTITLTGRDSVNSMLAASTTFTLTVN